MLVDGLKDAGRLADWFDLLPQAKAGVWTAKKNIGITLSRQKFMN